MTDPGGQMLPQASQDGSNIRTAVDAPYLQYLLASPAPQTVHQQQPRGGPPRAKRTRKKPAAQGAYRVEDVRSPGDSFVNLTTLAIASEMQTQRERVGPGVSQDTVVMTPEALLALMHGGASPAFTCTSSSPGLSTMLQGMRLEQPSVEPKNDSPLTEDDKVQVLLKKVNEKQAAITKRHSELAHRALRLQATLLGVHASEELCRYVRHAQKELNIPDGEYQPPPLSTLNAENTKGLSTSALISLVRSMAAPAARRPRTLPKYFQTEEAGCSQPVSKLRKEVNAEAEKVAGQLGAHIQHVQSMLDSDATCSSSGSESGDEADWEAKTSMVPEWFKNPKMAFIVPEQTTTDVDTSLLDHISSSVPGLHKTEATGGAKSLRKRYRSPAWQYMKGRAQVGSRWGWLQANVSDLEFKIRQYGSLYRQLRQSKGAVMLGGSEEDSCCRTRPLVNFRKRELVRVPQLQSTCSDKKTTVKCSCMPPNIMCVLCCGMQPMMSQVDAEYMAVAESAGLLDQGYHSVLSFPEDIPLHTHLEAILKSEEWMKMQALPSKLPRLPSKHVRDHHSKRMAEHVEQKRKPSTQFKKAALSSNLRKLKASKTGHDMLKMVVKKKSLQRLKRKRQAAKIAMAFHKAKVEQALVDQESRMKEDAHDYVDTDHDSASSGSKYSPVGSPGADKSTEGSSHHQRKDREKSTMLQDLLKRKRENSYDIDNIVIPYSIAASTRVEKLQYKEILTPKWRLVDEPQTAEPMDASSSGKDSEGEDISEEVYAMRHDRCEIDEKKKFSGFVMHPGRNRARRADSRAESSGGNTPDRMSPTVSDAHMDSYSPLTTPPGTPLSLVDDNSQPGTTVRERRRTASFSRHKEKEESHPMETADDLPSGSQSSGYAMQELRPGVAPYEPRVFPLPDATYEQMAQEMPPNHSFTLSPSPRKYARESNDQMELCPPLSPHSDSMESAAEDDPDDPEWTIKDNEERARPGLVLKAAKR